MDRREIDYIDNIILNEVKNTRTFDDVKTAELLHCPRILLLSRLEKLIDIGYVERSGENLELSKTGNEKMVPLYEIEFSDLAASGENAPRFNWHKLYIPSDGWADEP